jgi:hypothetical protein
MTMPYALDLQQEVSQAKSERLAYLYNERDQAYIEVDEVNSYIADLDDEIRELEFGGDL